jgi:predicted phage gp36 major capsid-like protein
MLAGDDSNGGYLLPPSTIGRVVKKIFELSPIRQIASVQNISTQALEGIYDNDESSYGWVGSRARTTTTTPTSASTASRRSRCTPTRRRRRRCSTTPRSTSRPGSPTRWPTSSRASRAPRSSTATGVGQPRGFASYTMTATGDATRTWGQIEKVKTGVNADFAASSPADKLFDLIQAFKTAYLQNASG